MIDPQNTQIIILGLASLVSGLVVYVFISSKNDTSAAIFKMSESIEAISQGIQAINQLLARHDERIKAMENRLDAPR